MKGWRPSARPRLEIGSGFFERAQFSPHIRAIVCLIPGSAPRSKPVPSASPAKRRPPKSDKGRQESAIETGASPSLLLQDWEEAEDKKRR
jgi:hypothetical protein